MGSINFAGTKPLGFGLNFARGGGAAETPLPTTNLLLHVDSRDADNFTLSSDLVDQWDDLVGSNHLTGTTTTRPERVADLSASGGPKGQVRFTSDALTIPSGISFDSRGNTVFVVSRLGADAITPTGSTTRGTFFHAPDSGTDFALYLWDSGQIRMFDVAARSTTLYAQSGVQTYWLSGGASSGLAGVGNAVWSLGSAFTSKTPSGGRIGSWSAGSFPLAGNIQCLAVYDGQLSESDRNAVLDVLAEHYGAPKSTNTKLFIFDGDSITEGIQADNPQLDPHADDFSYPSQLQILRASDAPAVANHGKGSQLIQNHTAATAPVRTLGAYSSHYATRVVFGLWGHNDIQGGRTSAQIKADLDTWIASIRAADSGAIIGHGTILESTGFDSGEETIRGEVNDYIDGTTGSIDLDFYIDTAAISDLTDASDTEFFVDGVHPTTAGYAALAAGVNSGLVSAGY